MNPEEKPKDLQKIKTTEEKFRNYYILNEAVIRPVNIFDDIVLEKGEERVEEKKEYNQN